MAVASAGNSFRQSISAPSDIHAAERSQQRRSLAIVPSQRAQRRSRRRLLVQALGDVVSQDGMRTDLEEHPVPGFDQLAIVSWKSTGCRTFRYQ